MAAVPGEAIAARERTEAPAGLYARFAKRMRPPRRVLPTRAGMITLSAPLLLGVAAINSSNNLLFLLVGACLGLITLSGMVSERLMRVVGVEVSPLGAFRAAEPGRLVVTLKRPTGANPLFDLRVRERPLSRRERRRAQGSESLDARLAMLEGTRGSVTAMRAFPRRGIWSLRPLELLTRYPFGLLTKACDVDARCAVIVRPRAVELPVELEDPLGLAEQGHAVNRRGLGDDFYGLREREERDLDARVHALRSLRIGRDVVVETEATRRPVAWVGVAGEGAEAEAFERALELAQAAIERWAARGWAVGLYAPGVVVSSESGSVDAVLDALATVEASGGASGLVEGAVWLVASGARAEDLGARAVFEIDAAGQARPRARRAAA